MVVGMPVNYDGIARTGECCIGDDDEERLIRLECLSVADCEVMKTLFVLPGRGRATLGM